MQSTLQRTAPLLALIVGLTIGAALIVSATDRLADRLAAAHPERSQVWTPTGADTGAPATAPDASRKR